MTREDLLGDLFHVGGLGYYAQLIGLTHIIGLQSGGHNILAAGTGTIGYEPNVDYFFGFQRSIKTGGIVFDIPIVRINGMNNGNLEQQKQFNIQFGLLSSALEHAVPEQMFTNAQNPGEAISAVKALQKANAAGQKIYHITQANMSSVLPNIHHNAKTKEEIQNALNAGKEVITHADAVSVPGWSGAGYIIFDPITGDGAYKIGGGANGGVLAFIGGFLMVIGLYLIPALTAPGLIALLPFYALTLGLLALVSGLIIFSSEMGPEFLRNVAMFRAIASYIAMAFLGTAESITVAIASIMGFAAAVLIPFLKDFILSETQQPPAKAGGLVR